MTGSAVPNLEWRETAVGDLLSIIDYIADDNLDAAQALKHEIEEKTARLLENPRMFREGRVTGTREMVVRPNYLVVYKETPDTITILRVLHAAQEWPED